MLLANHCAGDALRADRRNRGFAIPANAYLDGGGAGWLCERGFQENQDQRTDFKISPCCSCCFRKMSIEECVSRPAPLIVSVACFAGDIAAPSELVSALPTDCGAALIFVQQLSAGRETQTLLAESLAKRTTLSVIHAHDGLVAEHGGLYVIPPNVTPTMTGARICLTPAASGIDCPADALFSSLAQQFGNNAIGVILSGGGSDRALGIRAIRHAGGITFAQYPGSARFPNIPISAIDTGCVDFVLRPNEIAHELVRISLHKEKALRGAFKRTQIAQLEPILTRRAPATASSLAE